MIPGRATPAGTAAYAGRAGRAGPGHFRTFRELTMSSVGLGSYLGDTTDAADAAYSAAVRAALAAGINLLDSAVNYRHMRSERAIGAALAAAVSAGEAARSEIVVATKGGYLPFDGAPPADIREYVEATWLRPGIIRPGELVAGCHCLAPAYLRDQIERSRRNLGVETIDIYYLHNPEAQLGEVPRDTFMQRVTAAVETLEAECAAGRIGFYGIATWNGLRREPTAPDALQLLAFSGVAETVAGPGHRFRAAQLPFNLAMTEAYGLAAQPLARGRVPLFEAARDLGIHVVGSASLMQGKLTTGLPDEVRTMIPGLATDAQRALQFARSAPGMGTALAGMGDPRHVAENAEVVAAAPLPADRFRAMFA